MMGMVLTQLASIQKGQETLLTEFKSNRLTELENIIAQPSVANRNTRPSWGTGFSGRGALNQPH